MIDTFVNYMQAIIADYGALGVFAATLFEEIIAPIPSPIVPLAAGFFLLAAEAPFAAVLLRSAFVIALPVAVGVSAGSSLVYAIGHWGGKPLIEKSKKWLGLSWRDLEKVENRLTKGRGDEITLFVLRVLPVVPGVAVSGFFGVVRYPFYRFLVITLAGAFTRALLLGLLGWQAGELYTVYADRITRWEEHIFIGIIAAAVIGGAAWYFRKNKKSKHKAQN